MQCLLACVWSYCTVHYCSCTDTHRKWNGSLYRGTLFWSQHSYCWQCCCCHHLSASSLLMLTTLALPPLFLSPRVFFTCHHHHHYVPSVVSRSAVMDLHRSRSCATLIQSLYDIFVHSLMLSVHNVLGLPRPLLPFILPSISNRCTPFPLIICPKYWHFIFW